MLLKIIFVCRALIIFAVVGLFGCVSVSDECGVTSVEWEDAREQLAARVGNNAIGTAHEVEVFAQLGHGQGIWAAFSPDGQQIISGSGDKSIILWDTTTGREIRAFTGHTHMVISVAFNPDGTQILSGSWDGKIKIWDTATGQGKELISCHAEWVGAVAFSTDGQKVLTGLSDKKIILWDIATGQELKTFSGHTDRVNSVAFSPDGMQVLSGSDDNTIKLWDTITGRVIRTFTWYSEKVSSVAFSSDGRHVISGSWDGKIKLWDTITGIELRTFTGHSWNVSSVVFSQDGRQILSGSFDGKIKLWDTTTGIEIKTFTSHTDSITGHTDHVYSVMFSPDGKQILSSGGKSIKLWDITTGNEIRTFFGQTNWILSSAFNPDGNQIISTSVDDTIKIWDTAKGQQLQTIVQPNIRSALFSPDGKQILFNSRSINGITIWDITTGQEIKTFFGHEHGAESVVFSPDGRQMLSSSVQNENFFVLWDVYTERIIKTFFGHLGSIWSVAFNPDGTKIVSGSSDNSIKLWDTATGQEIRTFYGHTETVFSAAFCPDGTRIISGAGDNNIKLWDSNTGQEIRTFYGHLESVYSVGFSPDGTKIISCSSDNNIKLWDSNTGHVIKTFSHRSRVLSVSFSPDGKSILSASYDGTVRLWDTATGKEIASFISFSGTDTQLNMNTRGSSNSEELNADISGEWIVITPDGYYAASPLGDRYLNVRVGNRVTGMDSFRHIFHNPDVVRARLNGEPDPVTKKTITIQEAASFFPSTITMQSPATSTSGVANLSVNIVDENQPIQNIKILVNGRLVGRDEFAGLIGARGLVPERASLTVTGNQKSFSFNIPLALDPGDNLVEVIAFNGYSEARHKITLSWLTDIQPALPNLWILAVGVNQYNDDKISNLNYCANDAREIVRAFREQEGKRYAKVNALVIADGEGITPTAENIRTGLSFLNDAGPRDTILLFLAGHGVNGKDGMFEFLPRDSIKNNDETFSNVITGDEISDVLDSPGNRLIFIDACHSGSVDNDRMVRQFMDTNAYVFASCRLCQK